MIEINCRPFKKIYPKSNSNVNFKIIECSIEEGESLPLNIPGVGEFLDGAKNFTATGNIEYKLDIPFTLVGSWKKSKYGPSFKVDLVKDLRLSNKEGVQRYLCSLEGISPLLAERIYNRFLDETYEILDNNPIKLMEIKGISRNKLEKIEKTLLSSKSIRNLMTYLGNFSIKKNVIERIYNAEGDYAYEKLKRDPYTFTRYGISFEKADIIGMYENISKNSPSRIDAAIIEIIKRKEDQGNTCCPLNILEEEVQKILDNSSLTRESFEESAKRLYTTKRLYFYNNFFYRTGAALAEYYISKVVSDLNSQKVCYHKDTSMDIKNEAKNCGLILAEEQFNACKLALHSPISIITGGPGTGKTSIIKVLLNTYKKLNREKEVLLIAPTGRAAKRMSESTGYKARTIHSALQLKAIESEYEIEQLMKEKISYETMLSEDLIIIDESSMLDIYLAKLLLCSLKPGCQIVFLGDINQLPSVGPGLILKELISSKKVPTIVLDKIYRQGEGSNIAINAKRINNGSNKLEEGRDFEIIKTTGEKILTALSFKYIEYVEKYGIENVCVLTPFRHKTNTGTKELNEYLRKLILRDATQDRYVKIKHTYFYTGDRIMNTKNTTQLSNGDVGTIVDIYNSDGETLVVTDFDGTNHELTLEEMENIELAYAITVHKSQGSEYAAVIYIADMQHKVMHYRNIIYTAVTRAKMKIAIVGEDEAITQTITRDDNTKRFTNLSSIITKKE